MNSIKVLLLLCTASGFVFSQQDSIYAVVVGDEATVWHKNAKSNCASKFDFEIMQSQDSIVITERDTVGPLVHCTCIFDLSVRFKNYHGSFLVMVYRQDLKKYFYQKDTTYFIGSTSFTLPFNQLPYFVLSKYQSQCGGMPVSVEERIQSLPESIQLEAYPNPFNPTTTISYRLPITDYVTLKVYNLLGQEIATLFEGVKQAGSYETKFDGNGLSSGMYVYRLQAGEYSITKKLSLIK